MLGKSITFVLIAAACFLSFSTSAAAQRAEYVSGGYIIVFKDFVNANESVPQVAKDHGLKVGYVYRYALKGFSAVVPEGRLRALERDPRVAYVARDMIRTINAQTAPTGIRRVFADSNPLIDIDGTDDFRVDADIAIIDTGIDSDHPDLNVVNSTSCLNSSGGGPPWARSYFCGQGGDDDHYHGTHVAGSAAAIDNGQGVVGVAPGARLWAVKVCDAQGSCPSSAIIAGIDHVTANAGSIEVANMSLGGSGFNQAEYDAIQNAVNAGVAFAVAAGNSDADAANYSPAAFDNVLTVSALADFDGQPGGLGSPTCSSDQDDTLANFSNWGSAVQIAAPGLCIFSTVPIERGEYGTLSGTSMASPHAAGALALLASANNPGNAADVQNLYNQVIASGNFNWTDDSGDGIKEPLLDVSTFAPILIPVGGGGGGDDPPTVNIDSPANNSSFESGTSISFSGTASDTEDGDVTGSISWTSSLDGHIGIGGLFSAVLSDGTHTITASVTDSGGNTVQAAVTVTVLSDTGGGDSLHIGDLDALARSYRGGLWDSVVTILVVDNFGNPVQGATVSGGWSGAFSGPASCSTDITGRCSVQSGQVSKGGPSNSSMTWTVTGVTHSSLTYNSAANSDPDGDSNGTSIVVNKP